MKKIYAGFMVLGFLGSSLYAMEGTYWKCEVEKAIRAGDTAKVKSLCGERCNVFGLEPLHLGASMGHCEFVERLLNGGVDVNERAGGQRTAIYYAAARGQRAVVELLLKRGAEVDAKKLNGATPLYIASKGGFDDIVSVLLEHKADVHAEGGWRRTPLHKAVHWPKVIKLLLNHGADPTLQDALGLSLCDLCPYLDPQIQQLVDENQRQLNEALQDWVLV